MSADLAGTVTSFRTEQDSAAETIVALFAVRLLSRSAQTVLDASRACGVPIGAVREAWRAWEDGRWKPAGVQPVALPAPGQHTRAARALAIRHSAKNPVPGMRRCSRCGDVLPLSAFGKRSKTSHLYRSACDDCLRAEHREWVNVKRATYLELVVAAGDAVEGKRCRCCRRPLEAGDTVLLSADHPAQGVRRNRERKPMMTRGARNIHALAATLRCLEHEAATGECAMAGCRNKAAGFVSGWDNHPEGICDDHSDRARELGYIVHPDPWAGGAEL